MREQNTGGTKVKMLIRARRFSLGAGGGAALAEQTISSAKKNADVN